MAKYPDVTVRLTKIDSNAFSILGHTAKALREAGVTPEEVEAYRKEAMSGDYDHLVSTTTEWVSTC